MLEAKNISIGVVFTGERNHNINSFFTTCCSDALVQDCSLIIIDNCCSFDLLKELQDLNVPSKFKSFRIIRNDKIESLPYNHNLIYFNADTEYVIHNNDEVWFKKDWLKKTIDWVNGGPQDRLAHLCRCSKGYYKTTIPKMGYFSLLLTGKDQSDEDVEYREMKYLENSTLSVAEFRQKNHELFCLHVIGGRWDHVYFQSLGQMCWMSELCIQPGEPDKNLNDSNQWLPGHKDLSETNKEINSERNRQFVGKQGLEDISKKFIKI